MLTAVKLLVTIGELEVSVSPTLEKSSGAEGSNEDKGELHSSILINNDLPDESSIEIDKSSVHIV
jgi:hypothetical protein